MIRLTVGCVTRCRRDSTASVAFEYAMLLAIMAVGAVVAISGVGGEIIRMWNSVSSQVAAANPDQ